MLSFVLRSILFLTSIGITLWMMYKIRKSKAKTEDSIFWLFFSFVLVVLSVFPQIAYWMSDLLGIQAPVNFIFLAILFVLIVKIFMLSVHVSRLESKLQDLVQRYAIDHKR